MRRKISGGACLVAMVALVVATAGIVFGGEEGPSALIEVTRHDFGEIFERKLYKHTFMVKNVGTADLRIEKVQPG